MLCSLSSSMLFQSTLPGWGATCFDEGREARDEFQSTLPGWGATDSDYEWLSRTHPISIHAPRMGSDGDSRATD